MAEALDICFASLLADPKVELRRPSSRITIDTLRIAANQFQAQARGPELADVSDVVFSGPEGRPLAGRRYRPTVHQALPGILYCHGGGFVFGNLDSHEAICRSLAAASGRTVLAVDYRLSPEHPYPAAVEDCLAAAWHATRFPDEFGLLPGAMGIAGDSAGGHIAVTTALAAGAAGLRFAHVGLLYPVIDPRCDSPSMHAFATGYMLTREAMQWFWECYAPVQSQREDERLSLLAANLSGLPSVSMVLAGYDPLHDEGQQFAERILRGMGTVEWTCFQSMIHGFAGMPQITAKAGEAIALIGRSFARHLPLPESSGNLSAHV